MITIKKVFTEMKNGEQACSPERPLTPEEKERVVAIWGDEENLFCFEKGDEKSVLWQLMMKANEPVGGES